MAEAVLPIKKNRLIFIDVMRGIAVVWMIETHVVDICLNGIYKSGFFYDILNISNGFVAVSFIFCAGAGFWLASMRKGDDYKKFKPPLWVYLRRLGFILLIGYWLHTPAFSLQKVMNLQHAQFITFYECDVLQNIVLSSLIALLVLMISPKLKYIPYIFIVLALVFFFLAPYIWSLDAMSCLPSFIGAYFSKPPLSKFPLFHWSGYFFAGAALTYFFMETENKKKFAIWGLIIGTVLMYVLYYTRDFTSAFPYVINWWHASPGHSFFRLTGAIAVFSLLYLLEKYFKENRFGDFMRLNGQESLYVYTFHIVIVYGSVANVGMKYFIGSRLGPIETFILFLALSLFCYACAYVWNGFKTRSPSKARWFITSVVVLFTLIFLFNPL